MADLGLSGTLTVFRSSAAEDPQSVHELERALVERVGPLGWIVEGAVQSVALGDVDAATNVWGYEAIDLLWERGLLCSPDGNANHRDVILAEDARAWALARRTERLAASCPPRPGPAPLEHLTVTSTPKPRADTGYSRTKVLVGNAR